jgi:hypothetical protein
METFELNVCLETEEGYSPPNAVEKPPMIVTPFDGKLPCGELYYGKKERSKVLGSSSIGLGSLVVSLQGSAVGTT